MNDNKLLTVCRFPVLRQDVHLVLCPHRSDDFLLAGSPCPYHLCRLPQDDHRRISLDQPDSLLLEDFPRRVHLIWIAQLEVVIIDKKEGKSYI